MTFSEAEILHTVASFVWPMLRIGSLFISIPVFSGQPVPARIRLILALAMTWLVTPLLPAPPPFELFTYPGLMIAIHQVFIGILSGFFLRMVFAAVVFGGQAIAYGMGLGFASMVDPQTGVQVPVVAQFYMMLTTLLFLATDGHLLLIEILVDSFRTIPVSLNGISHAGIWSLMAWSSRIFAGGVWMALPVMLGLLLVNIGFGVATRAAPQLNVFAVGFVVSILLGLWLIWLTLPVMSSQFSGLLDDSYRALSGTLGM
ncbi:MAG: flagellar biosynthetic protein FliR [Methylococcaceae bacterium]|nr:flagellar biosynthetic protein FliR [Methylococcaceae bacterium]